MEWLENYKFFFFSQQIQESSLDVAVQSVLVVCSAIFSAYFTNYFAEERAKKEKEEQRKKLESSTRRKLGNMARMMTNLHYSFFSDVPEGTDVGDQWKFVRPSISVPDTIQVMSDAEFSAIEELEESLSIAIDNAIHFGKANFVALNAYSVERSWMNELLQAYAIDVDSKDETFGAEISATENMALQIKMYEIGSLCQQVKSNLLTSAEECQKLLSDLDDKLASCAKTVGKKKAFSKLFTQLVRSVTRS